MNNSAGTVRLCKWRMFRGTGVRTRLKYSFDFSISYMDSLQTFWCLLVLSSNFLTIVGDSQFYNSITIYLKPHSHVRTRIWWLGSGNTIYVLKIPACLWCCLRISNSRSLTKNCQIIKSLIKYMFSEFSWRTTSVAYQEVWWKRIVRSGSRYLLERLRQEHANQRVPNEHLSDCTVARRSCHHYENTPIQIYRKFHLQKLYIHR